MIRISSRRIAVRPLFDARVAALVATLCTGCASAPQKAPVASAPRTTLLKGTNPNVLVGPPLSAEERALLDAAETWVPGTPTTALDAAAAAVFTEHAAPLSLMAQLAPLYLKHVRHLPPAAREKWVARTMAAPLLAQAQKAPGQPTMLPKMAIMKPVIDELVPDPDQREQWVIRAVRAHAPDAWLLFEARMCRVLQSLAGRTLEDAARAQQAYHEAHGTYATDLAATAFKPGKPPRYAAQVIRADATQYTLRAVGVAPAVEGDTWTRAPDGTLQHDTSVCDPEKPDRAIP